MTQTYSLSWSGHINSISNGLCTLQQNEEFVDMTLAADGHFVKVHKVIMALASPYIKQIISSMKCDHPVIFLNRVSYTTLTKILEYIYTGEVFVECENMNEFIVAARDLYINGLEDMKLVNETQSIVQNINTLASTYDNKTDAQCDMTTLNSSQIDFENTDLELKGLHKCVNEMSNQDEDEKDVSYYEDTSTCLPTLQYTVSNRGSLQMILNKFVYYLKHTNKNNSRQWRCVDYITKRKCRASVFTQGDAVVQRIAAHNHPIHEKKIHKKFKSGTVFTTIRDARNKGLELCNTSKETVLISE